MAQRTLIQLLDDLDGSEASATVEFALDGKAYQIDLSDHNASRLRADLEPFIEAARQVGGGRRRRPANQPQAAGRQPTSPSPGSGRVHNTAVREWARANSWDIADRGRIPANVLAAYESRKN